ncbi:HERV-H LTR-associating protein 1 [Erythrolamprus reginae]|uniref:HERV-H LTR-associating protein 1 n=1 Tax=Erythrolamprus reginae TaxID=121349 RepID=UPI00396C71C1
MNLTGMVNGMLNTALRGTKEFFSLLSIVSYSSYAFHKVSIVLYNISSLKNIDPTKFSTRYCYCLNNRTNDLTDFTALLVDIVGNSTSYLTEIFKSTSIVSARLLEGASSQQATTECPLEFHGGWLSRIESSQHSFQSVSQSFNCRTSSGLQLVRPNMASW